VPSSISTCLLVAAGCASGWSVVAALALVGVALLFEVVLALGSS
jgi:hypothetical protein